MEKKYPTHYVGVGASAGGLEAIERLFSKMPEDTNMAFIIIQHLAPDYKSFMVELLSKKTSLNVLRANDGALVEPNNIYLIPPKKNMTIYKGKLFLAEQIHDKGINLPIDIFLKSLAEDQKEKAISIILSGTGSDGTIGVRSIKENGGIIITQDENTAKFDGMPKSSRSTGLVDFVLAPENMPELLQAISQKNYTFCLDQTDKLVPKDSLSKIFSILKSKFNTDFSNYKQNTIKRRIERRITVNQLNDIDEYIDFLTNFKSEPLALYKDLLIGVTNFFRDTEVFNMLEKQVIPEIISKNNNLVRIWVPGCSTGEEAYSIAITCCEVMNILNIFPQVKIFATDIDLDALQKAGAGEYPEAIAADISPGKLMKYFTKKTSSYTISSKIREMVVFAKHNIITDPPFANINIVSCRNLLIYLEPVLQKKVLGYFNFSLTKNGYLVLGSSETTGEFASFFEPLDHKSKIYKALGRRIPTTFSHKIFTQAENIEITPINSHYASKNKVQEEDKLLSSIIHNILLDILPLVIIVNKNMEVIYTIGDTNGFFKIPPGKMFNQITKMSSPEIAIPISTGLQKVFSKKEPVTYSKIKLNNEHIDEEFINLYIRPFTPSNTTGQMAAIIIENVTDQKEGKETPVLNFNVQEEISQRIKGLEQDLQFTEENLQATIEELETSNEELQSTNEELLASNQELQSTNEELQSVNEELYTVNAEHQQKIIELTELNNDMDNLFSSTRIGTIFLDENLEIRKFTPEIKKIFKILDHDKGRPLHHINHIIENIDPIELINKVITDNSPIEKEVYLTDESIYLMKIIPYAISPISFSGVVITFINITAVKETQEDLNKESRLVSAIINTTPSAITMVDKTGSISFANRNALDLFDITQKELSQRQFDSQDWKIEDFKGNAFPKNQLPFNIVKATKKPAYDIKHTITLKNNEKKYLNISSSPLFNEEKEFDGTVSVINDITNEVISKKDYETMKNQYNILFKNMPIPAVSLKIQDQTSKHYQILNVNKSFEKETNVKQDKLLNKNNFEVTRELPWLNDMVTELLQKSNEKSLDLQNSTILIQNKLFHTSIYSPLQDHFIILFTPNPNSEYEQ